MSPRFVLLASVLIGTTAPGTAPAADDASAARAIGLAFLNAPPAGAPLVDVPRLAVGIGSAMGEAVVDTGSTGVVLSASAIPGVDRLATLGPGTITYSSSGRIMIGRWVVTPLVIAGRTGRIVTRPMPVLAVDTIRCTQTARRCTPVDRPAHVAMLGIGFGREHDRQPGGTPDRNPLLNVAQPSGLARSYVLTLGGIRIGAAAAGFETVKLDRDAEHADWYAPAACIALDAGERSCGTVLVDTGITGMFLTVPANRLPSGGDGRSLPNGTAVTINLMPGTPQGLRYGIATGRAGDPATPTSVTLSGIGKRPVFVNTGARFLNRFDYLYDAARGIVGYRPIPR